MTCPLTPVSFFAGEQSSLKNRLSRILYGYEQRYRYYRKDGLINEIGLLKNIYSFYAYGSFPSQGSSIALNLLAPESAGNDISGPQYFETSRESSLHNSLLRSLFAGPRFSPHVPPQLIKFLYTAVTQ